MTITKEFLQVLLKVQSELPVVGKNETATGMKFSYKYATIDQVWDSVKDVLQKNGFVITNAIAGNDSAGTYGVVTNAIHELGTLESFIPFSSPTLEPQKRGSEITYARRYNLTAIFNIIVAGEDDDAQATKTSPNDPIEAWDDDHATPGLGVCKDCGQPNTKYKSGKVGCSKYCWRK